MEENYNQKCEKACWKIKDFLFKNVLVIKYDEFVPGVIMVHASNEKFNSVFHKWADEFDFGIPMSFQRLENGIYVIIL